MKWIPTLLTLVSVNAFSQDIISRPIEREFEINTVCQVKCDFESEILAFKKIYKGNSRNKIVNFIDSKNGYVAFSVLIDEIYASDDKFNSVEISNNNYIFNSIESSSGVESKKKIDDSAPSVGIMDGALDCYPGSRDHWCTDGWKNSPEWEDYKIAVYEQIFNSRHEILVTEELLESIEEAQEWTWAVITAVPAGRVTSGILKMIERFGAGMVNRHAAESLVGGTVGFQVGKLAKTSLKVGDILLYENGKRIWIRNGVVLDETELMPQLTTPRTDYIYGSGNESYTPPWLQNTSGGSFCFLRTFGSVTTGGGTNFWVSYEPCGNGIYEP